MTKIKNIILDFGGVIINLDIQKTHNAFKELGINKIPNDLLSDILNFEAGLLTETEMRNAFKRIAPNINDNEFDNAWCQILRDLPQYRVDFLHELGKKYPLYLLSNTNSIHIDFLRKRDNGKFEKFEKSFAKVFYSYQMQCRKPDAIIFEKVIDDLKIKPEETIFVDDMLDNIETAKQLGFQTWHFDVEKDDITNIEEHLN